MLQGHRTWVFENKPVIISTGVVGGPFEAKGNIPEDFDILHEDLWLGQDSYEKHIRFYSKKLVVALLKKQNFVKMIFNSYSQEI